MDRSIRAVVVPTVLCSTVGIDHRSRVSPDQLNTDLRIPSLLLRRIMIIADPVAPIRSPRPNKLDMVSIWQDALHRLGLKQANVA